MRTLVVVAVLFILGLIVLSQSAYTVDQTEQAIITRFGEVRAIKSDPGLYFKTPFMDRKTVYDRRVLSIDAPAEAMLDRERQPLVIDSYTRYRILPCPPEPIEDLNQCGAVQFRRTLQTDSNARSRIGAIVIASLRAEIANNTRVQIIGGQVIEEPGQLPRVEPTESRSEILSKVLTEVRRTIADAPEPFGVEVIDVRIKRADFPESVAEAIYTRMRAERNRIASGFRAEGDRQDLEIRADVNRRRDITLAEAERDSNIARGEGEAQAINIFAQALQEDPEFYAFRRSLDAYRTFLNRQTTIVISSEAELFRFIQSPFPTTPPGGQPPAPAGAPTGTPPPPWRLVTGRPGSYSYWHTALGAVSR